MIWNEQYECMERERLGQVQSRRLVDLVGRLYAKVPFYRDKMDEKGIKLGSIAGIADIFRLPFLTKGDMRKVYPYGLLAVEHSEIVEVHLLRHHRKTRCRCLHPDGYRSLVRGNAQDPGHGRHELE